MDGLTKEQYEQYKKMLPEPSYKELIPEYHEVEKYYLMLKDFPEVMRGNMSFEGEELQTYLRCQNFMMTVLEFFYNEKKIQYNDLVKSVELFKDKLKESDKNIQEGHDKIIGLHKSVIEDSDEQINSLDEQIDSLRKKDKLSDKLIDSQNKLIDSQKKVLKNRNSNN